MICLLGILAILPRNGCNKSKAILRKSSNTSALSLALDLLALFVTLFEMPKEPIYLREDRALAKIPRKRHFVPSQELLSLTL